MNPLFVKWAAMGAVVLGLMAASGAAAWRWQTNHYERLIAETQNAHMADLVKIASAAAQQAGEALARQQRAELQTALIDEQATEDRAHDLAENDRLHAQYTRAQSEVARLGLAVTAGYERLRIAGRCSTAAAGNVPAAPSAAGVDDGGTVELSAGAGSTVFSIRAGIIKDQSALAGLQRYVREVCLNPQPTDGHIVYPASGK